MVLSKAIWAWGCLAVSAGGGWGQTVRDVATPEALAKALADVAPGTVLQLAGGDYGKLTLAGAQGEADAPVVLRSADPADPARLTGMDLREVQNLTLEGLVFDYVFDSEDAVTARPFRIDSSTGVTIRDSLFDGDLAKGVSVEEDGFPTGTGLVIADSSGISLTDSVIKDFARGALITGSQEVTLRGNDLHSLRIDGLGLAQVSHVRIEDNGIHDFKRVPGSLDHADMIQFWTGGTTLPSSDITIRGNILNSGGGKQTQSIFMRNDLVDRGIAGPEMFYRNVTIEENVVINAHLHGISIGETAGLTIRNNSVLRNAASQGSETNLPLWTPQIRVAPTATDVHVLRNVTSKITGYNTQADWEVRENFFVQDLHPRQQGFYDTVFVAARTGDPRKLGSFAYLPGGPLAGAGIGAPQLGQPSVGTPPAPSDLEPVIRVLADQDYANRFTFDAGVSALSVGVDLTDARFGWDFGDGTQSDGSRVTHTFERTGPQRVVLTLSLPDGRAASTSADIDVRGADVLLFSSKDGTFISYAMRDPVILAKLTRGKGPAILGQGMAPIVTRPEMIAPFFEAKDFELRLRMRGAGTFRSAGELLRIHETLLVNVTKRGMLDVRFSTATGAQLKILAGPVNLFSQEWQDVVFDYSAETGIFAVKVNDRIIGQGKTFGTTPPLAHWGLSLGNPFQNRKSFDGEVEALSLRVNRDAVAPLN